MKKLLLILIIFCSCSSPSGRKEVVNLTSPDSIIYRQHPNTYMVREIFITIKDSCVYVMSIEEDTELNYYRKLYCF